jgi:hypothetical protein
VGPSSPGGPTPSHPQTLPTLEQLLILVARAERKGGLDYVEGDRLRAGLLHFAGQHSCRVTEAPRDLELLRKYNNARKHAWSLKKKSSVGQPARAATAPADSGSDDEARDALRRVVELAQRWTHIPAKRQAGVSVLSTIRNVDAE